MSQSPQHRTHKLIELLILDFADTSYRHKSTSAGSARRTAFSTFASSLPPPRTVKWSSCIEDARKVFVLSAWEPGRHDPDRSVKTIVKPLTEHLADSQWSRHIIVLDQTSVDITSSLWGPFLYEIRILDLSLPNEHKQRPVEYWMKQEENVGKMLVTLRDTLSSFSRIGSSPPAVADLGYLGLVGGWVTPQHGSEADAVDMKSSKWVGILGWRDESGERIAWGDDAGPGQECLRSLCSIAEGAGQRWHATKFERLGDSNHKYAFSSSDEEGI